MVGGVRVVCEIQESNYSLSTDIKHMSSADNTHDIFQFSEKEEGMMLECFRILSSCRVCRYLLSIFMGNQSAFMGTLLIP